MGQVLSSTVVGDRIKLHGRRWTEPRWTEEWGTRGVLSGELLGDVSSVGAGVCWVNCYVSIFSGCHRNLGERKCLTGSH